MTFNMYKYTGERDVINKTLTNGISGTGYYKDDTEFENPVLVLNNVFSVDTSNYFIIDGKNYFVNGVTYSQQRLLVQLELDHLETYKDQILNNYAILDRSSNKFNAYQVDADIPAINSNEITVTKFPNGFSGESMILTVAGG